MFLFVPLGINLNFVNITFFLLVVVVVSSENRERACLFLLAVYLSKGRVRDPYLMRIFSDFIRVYPPEDDEQGEKLATGKKLASIVVLNTTASNGYASYGGMCLVLVDGTQDS